MLQIFRPEPIPDLIAGGCTSQLRDERGQVDLFFSHACRDQSEIYDDVIIKAKKKESVAEMLPKAVKQKGVLACFLERRKKRYAALASPRK